MNTILFLKDLLSLLTNSKAQVSRQGVVSFDQQQSISCRRQLPEEEAAQTLFPWLPALTIFFTELSIANFSPGLSGKPGGNR